MVNNKNLWRANVKFIWNVCRFLCKNLTNRHFYQHHITCCRKKRSTKVKDSEVTIAKKEGTERRFCRCRFLIKLPSHVCNVETKIIRPDISCRKNPLFLIAEKFLINIEKKRKHGYDCGTWGWRRALSHVVHMLRLLTWEHKNYPWPNPTGRMCGWVHLTKLTEGWIPTPRVYSQVFLFAHVNDS